MIPWILVGIFFIIIIFLITKKTAVDKIEKENYEEELKRLKEQKQDLNEDIRLKTDLIQDYNNKLLKAKESYEKELNKKNDELNQFFENQKQIRQAEIDELFSKKQQECQNKIEAAENNIKIEIDRLAAAQNEILEETQFQEKRFDALIEPIKQYEKERQEKLFYTIQVPEEYRDDINFLLTSVAEKIKHPDVISKLIWANYVKPYIDDTFRRVGIKDEPGIYKLTSLINGKCYIGKSTNIKKRISDHMKSVVGISTIANQAVHDIISREGYWNWTIEPIIYCEKEQLNELEKYYINFFKSQEFGYNVRAGG